ncbi:protein NCBP2AS2 homolog [Ostrea edulis]|uniref:protein NCBP2AS2 homolog n=1 Tax=Ostrea edulis TaxID=37623 RepID=UPI002094E5D6|nr:protein NCBP2AS2 homolog [Ostrea edulis]
MVLKFLLRLLHHENVIQKIADSPPIRQAARYVVTIYHRFHAGEMGDLMKKFEKMATKDTPKSTNAPPKQIGFTETFKRELREGFKDLEQKSKKQ